MLFKNKGKSVNNLPKIVENRGLGWFWGGLGETWEAVWSQEGPKLKKGGKSEFVDPPGTKLGPKSETKCPKMFLNVFAVSVVRGSILHSF